MRDPSFTRSVSIKIEKLYIAPGTVRVANILKVMKSQKKLVSPK